MPDFTAETSKGKIRFHEWLTKDDKWTVFFSHPADFTPVCTTELAGVERIMPEMEKRNVKLIGLSCSPLEEHMGFIEDIKSYCNFTDISFPIIADPKREVAELYGMMDPVEKDKAGMLLTCRAVFVIGPDKKLKLSFLYPATTGRNLEELLRVIDSLQLTAKKAVATPVNWKPGDNVIVAPNVKKEDLPKLFPQGVKTVDMPSGKEYMRFTPMPKE